MLTSTSRIIKSVAKPAARTFVSRTALRSGGASHGKDSHGHDAHGDDHGHHDHPMYDVPFGKGSSFFLVFGSVIFGSFTIWFSGYFQNRKNGFIKN